MDDDNQNFDPRINKTIQDNQLSQRAVEPIQPQRSFTIRDPSKIILPEAPRSMWDDESKNHVHHDKEQGFQKIWGDNKHKDRVNHLFSNLPGSTLKTDYKDDFFKIQKRGVDKYNSQPKMFEDKNKNGIPDIFESKKFKEFNSKQTKIFQDKNKNGIPDFFESKKFKQKSFDIKKFI